ncbi:suppressor of fused domain protein [Flammeovirga agarivorans]|uniref:Suppressor of fused domain protein n=1 Tax=Flammeovirga agarivorans TaxID=2726742 RepID=A0A7X8SRM6_9BACT|nr:suppressor of fused domain protein [Flammeovirga agarivorans]NLR95091.1 suppressor of fused domain protein [Flammeovirga agarivorans]
MYDNYFAIDGGEWPSKGLFKKVQNSSTIISTVALSFLPMPTVELYLEDYQNFNRIELGLRVNDLTETHFKEIANQIGPISKTPWENITFLGEGHTLNLKINDRFESVLLTKKISSNR